MTEQEREKLVEAMCAAFWDASGGIITWRDTVNASAAGRDLGGLVDRAVDVRVRMRAALAAIDASGIAWVAPWEMTVQMIEAVVQRNSADRRYGVNAIVTAHRDAREACLAERLDHEP